VNTYVLRRTGINIIKWSFVSKEQHKRPSLSDAETNAKRENGLNMRDADRASQNRRQL
jgi:hypothetical protein